MMNLPLDFLLLRSLRRGADRLTPKAKEEAKAFVRSQMTPRHAFVNRGGKEDLYYTMFGWMMCYALRIDTSRELRGEYLAGICVEELDELHSTVYRQCGLIHDLLAYGLAVAALRHWRERRHLEQFMQTFARHTAGRSLNGVAASLFGENTPAADARASLDYIASLQDPTGGFFSSESSEMPDLLSTAVALFTLRAYGVEPQHSASDFMAVHFSDNGSFMPNLIDHQSDVEYSFYGFLGLGCAD